MDINYAELFGLDDGNQGADGAAEGTEAATGTNNDGEKGQTSEDTENQGDGAGTGKSGEGEDLADKSTAKDGKSVQAPEERAKHAERRRQKEESDRIRREAEIDAAAELKAKKLADERVARLGQKNTFTGRPITTVEEYDEFERQRSADAAEKALKRAGIPKDVLESIVANHPDVVAAREAATEMKTARLQASEAAGRAKLESEVAEISKADPDIKTLDDIKALPNFEAIYTRVAKNGLSLSEAYRLENWDKLTSAKGEAARQAALNSANSRNHLQSDMPHGSGMVPVPKQAMEYYKLLSPDMTDEEITRNYNDYLKKG